MTWQEERLDSFAIWTVEYLKRITEALETIAANHIVMQKPAPETIQVYNPQ